MNTFIIQPIDWLPEDVAGNVPATTRTRAKKTVPVNYFTTLKQKTDDNGTHDDYCNRRRPAARSLHRSTASRMVVDQDKRRRTVQL
jgi:hypothetical protein